MKALLLYLQNKDTVILKEKLVLFTLHIKNETKKSNNPMHRVLKCNIWHNKHKNMHSSKDNMESITEFRVKIMRSLKLSLSDGIREHQETMTEKRKILCFLDIKFMTTFHLAWNNLQASTLFIDRTWIYCCCLLCN